MEHIIFYPQKKALAFSLSFPKVVVFSICKERGGDVKKARIAKKRINNYSIAANKVGERQ